MNSGKVTRYHDSEKKYFEACGVQVNEHFIEIKKLSIRIRVLTAGNGSPLLFVHGAPAAAAIWMPLIKNLQGYKNIIIDRPGCGLSERTSYKDLSRDQLQSIMVSTIDAVLDHFKIPQLPVVSSSFGSGLTLLYALKRTGRISKLVIEGAPALINGTHVPSFMKPMLLPGLRWIIPRLPTTTAIMKEIMIGLGHRYSIEQQVITPAFIDWYKSLLNNSRTQVNEISMIVKAYPLGKARQSFMLSDNEIEDIKQPTLLLWSTDDPFGGIQTAERFKTKLNNALLIPFENCGHLPWLDKPEIHAEEIKKFIGSKSEDA
jgi:pimeloyl-ACP methyl ester carboxylesterase